MQRESRSVVAVTYQYAHNIQNPDEADQILWGQVISGDGFHVMAYGPPPRGPGARGENPFLVSVSGRDAAEIILTDQFGVTWVLDVVAETTRPEHANRSSHEGHARSGGRETSSFRCLPQAAVPPATPVPWRRRGRQATPEPWRRPGTTRR